MPGPIDLMKKFSPGRDICVECREGIDIKKYTHEEREDWKSTRVCKRCAEKFLTTAVSSRDPKYPKENP